MKWALALLVLIVMALHQDFWLWRNKTLVFGFIPIGLAYQMGFSVLAACTMALLVHTCWPAHLETLEAAAPQAPETLYSGDGERP